MGATNCTTCLGMDVNPSRVHVHDAFRKMVEADRYMNGHNGYTGSWSTFGGLRVVDKDFDTTVEAVEWILDNHEKWGPALVVKATDVTGKRVWVLGGWAAE